TTGRVARSPRTPLPRHLQPTTGTKRNTAGSRPHTRRSSAPDGLQAGLSCLPASAVITCPARGHLLS
ncbi:MAG: hypothetical protein LKK01_11050, partial [Prevotella sp.]|nr:hypothetical protein [Prevotella sp.]